MTDQEREPVVLKLQFMREALRKLKKYQSLSMKDFHEDERNEYTVERLFQTALEAVIDMARYVIISQQLQKPGDIRGEFEILADANFISAELAERLSRARGFRNVLVHEYVAIEWEIVYRNLQEDLGDLEEFAKIVAKIYQD